MYIFHRGVFTIHNDHLEVRQNYKENNRAEDEVFDIQKKQLFLILLSTIMLSAQPSERSGLSELKGVCDHLFLAHTRSQWITGKNNKNLSY